MVKIFGIQRKSSKVLGSQWECLKLFIWVRIHTLEHKQINSNRIKTIKNFFSSPASYIILRARCVTSQNIHGSILWLLQILGWRRAKEILVFFLVYFIHIPINHNIKSSDQWSEKHSLSHYIGTRQGCHYIRDVHQSQSKSSLWLRVRVKANLFLSINWYK